MLNVKCNKDYGVQNDESLRGAEDTAVQMREESESGIRK